MLIGRAAASLSAMLNDRAFCCFSAIVHAGLIRSAAEALHVMTLSRRRPALGPNRSEVTHHARQPFDREPDIGPSRTDLNPLNQHLHDVHLLGRAA
jgi:hypothetical protein